VRALSLAGALVALVAAGQSQRDVLTLAGRHVARLGEELPRLVATETLDQQASHADGSTATRRTVAEFGWVQLPGEIEALGFRDVVEVDGVAVADRGRLVDLLHGETPRSWAQARAIVEAGARHNLAPGSRNFNLPTVALFFVHPGQQRRFKWSRATPEDAVEWELEFRERDRPTVIRTGSGRPIYSRGRIRLDPASGLISRTELRLEFDEIRYTLLTRFERVPAIDLHVPVAMEERFESEDVVVIGRATYSKYRRFETTGRLLR
jgi:hypothetical protein